MSVKVVTDDLASLKVCNLAHEIIIFVSHILMSKTNISPKYINVCKIGAWLLFVFGHTLMCFDQKLP